MSTRPDLAKFIDHTLLRPDADAAEVRAVCAETLAHGFASVCVASRWVPLAADVLRGGVPVVCSVIGFPHGDASTAAKVAEAARAVLDGAGELDVVVARGPLRSGDDAAVLADLRAVIEAAEGRPVKVILETAALDEATLLRGSHLAVEAGAAFVKTSTGFGPGGASVEAIAAMRAAVGPHVGVKASGGIRDAAIADEMLAAGATRLGASASVAIVSGAPSGAGY